jgi:hypothetical protein
MPKRGSDADTRVFFDELVGIKAATLKASGVIKLTDQQLIIPFPNGKQKLIAVVHTVFRNRGSWSYFRCPKCGARSKKLWLVEDAPRCMRCCWSLGVRYRSAYSFGRTERMRERDRRIDRLEAMLEGGPMRLKPVPPGWGDRRLDRRKRITAAVERARIFARLRQFGYEVQQSSKPQEPLPRTRTSHQEPQSSKPDEQLPLLRAYKPRSAAIEAVPQIKTLQQAKSTEDLERALDEAEAVVRDALRSGTLRQTHHRCKLNPTFRRRQKTWLDLTEKQKLAWATRVLGRSAGDFQIA